MEVIDNLKHKPNAMADAFQEAMRRRSAKGGNPAATFNMTKLPVGSEVKVLGKEKLTRL